MADKDIQNHPAQFFVGGIEEAVTEENLRTYFETYGELELLILKRADPPKKPFAFVAFVDKEHAEAVLDNYANNKVKTDGGGEHWIDVRWCRQDDWTPLGRTEDNKPSVGGDKTLFVGLLPEEAGLTQIKELLEPFGKIIDIDLKKHMDTGKSKGFAFVEFDSSEVAQQVLDQNGTLMMDERPLLLQVRNRATADKHTAPERDGDPNTVFVGGVPPEMGVKELREYFSSFGTCKIDLKMNPTTQRHRGFAFVIMDDESVAKQIIDSEEGHSIGGVKLDVKAPKHGASKFGAKGFWGKGKGKGFGKGEGKGFGKGGGYDQWGGDSAWGGYGGGAWNGYDDGKWSDKDMQAMMGMMSMFMGGGMNPMAGMMGGMPGMGAAASADPSQMASMAALMQQGGVDPMTGYAQAGASAGSGTPSAAWAAEAAAAQAASRDKHRARPY